MKYKSIADIRCPFCGGKPILIDKDRCFPTLYCLCCKEKLKYEETTFCKLKLYNHEENEYCKKHNEVFDKDDDEDYCRECRTKTIIKEASRLRFSKNQKNFMRKYNHWEVRDAILGADE